MDEYIVVLCTVPDKESGANITQSLLENKLCACINIISEINSFYWWQGKIEQSHESMLLIKTTKDKYKSLEKHIKSIHPYDNPEIIMQDIQAGSEQYLAWITQSIDK